MVSEESPESIPNLEDDRVNQILFSNWVGGGDDYNLSYDHLFEQYKLYVGTAEANSDRRQIANGFFLTLNTALLAFVGLMVSASEQSQEQDSIILRAFGSTVSEESDQRSFVPILSAVIVGISICYIWIRLIGAYRNLNSGKFDVIHRLERRLPAAIFEAEWEALGKGEESRIHRPFTHVETLIPKVFGTLYLVLGVWQTLSALGLIAL